MMGKKRGIVFEKKRNHSILLTDQGEFVRGIPVLGEARVGDEVEFLPVRRSIFTKRKPAFIGFAVAAAVLLMFIVSVLLPNPNNVMAYVQLDTDESIELGIDEDGNVITLRQLQESESEKRFEEWKGQSLRKVLDEVVSNNSSKVMLTMIIPKDEHKDKVQVIVESTVKEIKSAYQEVELEVQESTNADRVDAIKKNMSVQEYKASQVAVPEKEEENPGKSDQVKEQKTQQQGKKPEHVGKPANGKGKEKANENAGKQVPGAKKNDSKNSKGNGQEQGPEKVNGKSQEQKLEKGKGPGHESKKNNGQDPDQVRNKNHPGKGNKGNNPPPHSKGQGNSDKK